ncbi:ABC transporter ATP-binding protein [Nocardia vermiculata]|uniref:ABC transporter ATP-binding protein n=1 Tax=Nocardia vermiculata TaxID=257274 RepID=A0A846XZH3_9NOCA|nr:ABC transporter ATP-binding protein [Nocardia vermiculata]NKY49669.1 ABC transporter ATP-binding protein [Nocardia vermiculata]
MLEIEDLNLTFGDTRILREVSLQVQPGEVVAVVGESGSGKSSLARTILGLHRGRIRVAAARLRLDDSELPAPGSRAWRSVRGRRVGYVPQDPGSSLNPVQRIGSQVREALRLCGKPSGEADAVDRLAEVGLADPSYVRRYPHELSGGQRQRVLIAMALAGRPGLVVADEPTSALDAEVADQVLDALTAQATGGTGLLLITHDLRVAADRAHRVVVLDGGRVVEAAPAEQVLQNPESTAAQALQRAMPGRRGPVAASAPGEPVLRARQLSKRFGAVTALDSAELTVHRGETVAVVGPSGSGKSTLARLLTGLTTADTGHVETTGGRVQLVAQNPLTALDPRWTVERIVAESLHPSLGLTRPQRAQRVREVLDDVGLGADFARRRPHELSGGQGQRVAIARALAPRPALIVLDEAVSALDVVSRATVLDILADLQASHGTAYVFITHDRLVARDIAHRTIEVRGGRVRELSTAETTRDNSAATPPAMLSSPHR